MQIHNYISLILHMHMCNIYIYIYIYTYVYIYIHMCVCARVYLQQYNDMSYVNYASSCLRTVDAEV